MEYAFAILGWSPDVFWNSTVAEIMIAESGQRKKNGKTEKPMTRKEFEELKKKLDGN